MTKQIADAHGWAGTGTLQTRFGQFEFEGGYPKPESARKLAELLTINRAVEVFLSLMHGVSWYAVWRGVATAGDGVPNQLVIWESLMDAQTLLLTGNTDTVYGMAAIDLKRDGPVVLELPPMLLGGISDIWQAEVAGIGPTGIERGKGGKLLLLPPGYTGTVPEGYMTAHATTYRLVFGVRGFQVDGKTDRPVALMKSVKIYPLAHAAKPAKTTFFNASRHEVDTIFADTFSFFEDLAEIVAYEPDCLSTDDWFRLAALGIEKGKPFTPDSERKALLAEAGMFGGAIARANSFASTDAARIAIPGRRWEWLFIGGSATWDSQGYVNTDRRAAFAYVAIGMSPAMVEKIVGGGSQYYGVYTDADGDALDGGRSYRLHYPPDIPVKNFWSVVVYDAASRSQLRNGQRFPSMSSYTAPEFNADGSIDFHFWTRTASERKSQLDPDRGRPRLVSTTALLRATRAFLRSELEARRHRKGMRIFKSRQAGVRTTGRRLPAVGQAGICSLRRRSFSSATASSTSRMTAARSTVASVRSNFPVSAVSGRSSPRRYRSQISGPYSDPSRSGAKRPKKFRRFATSRSSIRPAWLFPAASTACGKSMMTGPSCASSTLNSERSPCTTPATSIRTTSRTSIACSSPACSAVN